MERGKNFAKGVIVPRPDILLTTPDYPPKLGGLSTFTQNIEKTLKEIDISYDLAVWTPLARSLRCSNHYKTVINIQYKGGLISGLKNARHVNFCHGSEILFTSPNFFRRAVKRLSKRSHLAFLESSYANAFISNFTFQTTLSQGLRPDYARDFILHNGIALSPDASLSSQNLEGDTLKLICVARDVPHKNLAGTVRFAETLADMSGKKVVLYLSSKKYHSSKVSLVPIDDISSVARNILYRQCHFNLLLSLDHSDRGFIEGFGLTVLEAGQFGTPSIVLDTGGLPESVHDRETGWVLKNISATTILKLWEQLQQESCYTDAREQCYKHTIESHGTAIYKKFLLRIFEETL
jgi:glycosyltransferase involved in cell wall biosynthesis